jgi:hypothetical protein
MEAPGNGKSVLDSDLYPVIPLIWRIAEVNIEVGLHLLVASRTVIEIPGFSW